MENTYKNLIVWQRAVELVIAIYELTFHFPNSEQYGLTSQIRRAAVSMPSNIAEGKTRRTGKDFRHFLTMAFASGAELETQLIIAKRLGFAKPELYLKADTLLNEVMKMLNVLLQKTSGVLAASSSI